MQIYASANGNRISEFGDYAPIETLGLFPETANWTDIQCSFTCVGDSVKAYDITDVFIQPDGVNLYGPYIVDEVDVIEEHRAARITARLDLHIDFLLVDVIGERLYGEFRQVVGRLIDRPPFAVWRSGALPDGTTRGVTNTPGGTAGKINGFDFADILFSGQTLKAKGLAEVRSALEQWGLTVVPYVNEDLEYSLRYYPLYPTDVFGYRFNGQTPGLAGDPADSIERRDRQTAAVEITEWDAIPAIKTPDSQNRIGNYETRLIKTEFRPWSNVGNVIFFEQGSTGAAHYLKQSNAADILVINSDIERWKMQNSAVVFEGIRRPFQDEDQYLAPRMRFLYRGSEWLVTSVAHAWTDAGNTYRQTVKASLWQGYGPIYVGPKFNEPPPPDVPVLEPTPDIVPDAQPDPQDREVASDELIFWDGTDVAPSEPHFHFIGNTIQVTGETDTLVEAAFIITGNRILISNPTISMELVALSMANSQPAATPPFVRVDINHISGDPISALINGDSYILEIIR